MGIIFKSKEVYKHLSKKPNEPNTMVPVQGLYVSGEFRPPYYNDPMITITSITSQDCNPASFKSEYLDFKDPDGCGMYKMDVSTMSIDIQRYLREFLDLPPDADGCGMYKMDVSEPEYTFMRYQREYDSTTDKDGCGMYKLNVIGTFARDQYHKGKGNSTPEPILRISGLVSENAVVENYNP